MSRRVRWRALWAGAFFALAAAHLVWPERADMTSGLLLLAAYVLVATS